MISADDSRRTVQLEGRYLVSPVAGDWGYQVPEGAPVPEGFAYRSDTNDLWMSTANIQEFILRMESLEK